MWITAKSYQFLTYLASKVLKRSFLTGQTETEQKGSFRGSIGFKVRYIGAGQESATHP